MPHHEFTFKKFKICQDRNVMRVGTDGVLLGSWVETNGAKKILDVGTGTGLLALMMAQKSDAMVCAVDIDPEAFEQAKENFENSPWKDRLQAYHISLQQYALNCEHRYDLIISNPPYFLDSHKAETESRNVARHLDRSLSIPDLADSVKRILSPIGRFCVIFPFKEGVKMMEYCETHGMYVNHITRVKTKAMQQEKRLLLEFSLVRKELVEDEITIQNEELKFTEQYRKLTGEFYQFS